MSSYERKDCRVCFKTELYTVLDLGNQPLANSYTAEPQQQEEYPLKLMWCSGCGHLQLSYVVDRELLYKHYQYVSGTSKTLDDYFKWFAKKVTHACESSDKLGSVLDIACNDGSQLNHFKEMGWDTYGVDPAENIVSQVTNHKMYNDFFTLDFAKKLDKTFNVIIAQNVLAHVDNVHDFVKGCKQLMDNKSTLYIQTSQCNMIQNNEFDTIYHEHHSFFNIFSMRTLLNENKLYLHRVEKSFIHGTSYIFTIKTELPTREQDEAIIEQLVQESYLHLLETYTKYAKKVHIICRNLIEQVSDLQKDGYKVIGYGAAAKGNTLLNYTKLQLDYIVDDSELKWGLYTPGMNIPILPPNELKKESNKLVILPLAWNFFDEIQFKVNSICTGSIHPSFLRYFPNVEMVYKTVKPKTTVIMHFYNEEYLLPFWLNHHKDMFDHGVLINYHSTDKSVDIIKQIVPHWTIIDTRNANFDSTLCDKEVMDIEGTIQGWKITLNVTEFLLCGDLTKLINRYKSNYDAIALWSIHMVESKQYETDPIDESTSLIVQRTFGIKDFSRKTRTFHCRRNGNYDAGRHNTRIYPHYNVPLHEAVVLWYGYSPMNENVLSRKLQIQTKMSDYDRANSYGKEHLVTHGDLIEKWDSYQSRLIDLRYDAEFGHYY